MDNLSHIGFKSAGVLNPLICKTQIALNQPIGCIVSEF
jgi:hypothetical protein